MSDFNTSAKARHLIGLFASQEVLIAVNEHPTDDNLDPKTIRIDEGDYVVAAFEETELASAGHAENIVAAPGRAALEMLVSAGVGLVLFGADEQIVMEPEHLKVIQDAVLAIPNAQERNFDGIVGLEETDVNLNRLIDEWVKELSGLAESAVLAGVPQDGSVTPTLCIIGHQPGTETAIAQSAQGLFLQAENQVPRNVCFAALGSQIAQEFIRLGTVFAVPKAVQKNRPAAPGSDPTKPPILH